MHRLRAFAIVPLAASAVLLAGAARATSSVPDADRGAETCAAGRDPILFVHGWRGDRYQWRPMLTRFRDDGWTDRELYSWTYDSGQPNAVTARQLSARVDQILVATGAERVDIVTHSMGALPARHYLKNGRSGGKVDAWVSLGGPNHGTVTAELCFSSACREMRVGSAFLAELNAGDQTPGEARYATWWSPCDELIDSAAVVLQGADNRRTGCIGHLELISDEAVYREVRDFVRR